MVPGMVHLLADIEGVFDDSRADFIRTEPITRLFATDDTARAERDALVELAIGCRTPRVLSSAASRLNGPCMLICMHSTSVRIDSATHDDLKRLADELQTTVGNTVTLAVRALRQARVGADLATPLRSDETAWLDADLG